VYDNSWKPDAINVLGCLNRDVALTEDTRRCSAMDLFAFARMKMEKKLLELEFHGITLLTARGHQDKHLARA